jgi:lipopolysaccharide transport system ATP-binding protein
MSTNLIRARGIGKRYRSQGPGPRYALSREPLTDILTRGWNRITTGFRADEESMFWAVRDVSFDVEEGEVVGVIGRNGAGKSTLLKILSRITLPTVGMAEVRGRVASLLEVGTGFHPELTGRENIYFNGVLLGVDRRTVAAKIDEIVDFAQMERFLDTPVKYYSNGMVVRLAFAVAAILVTDIVLLDEVLAVGDIAFQRKCADKIHQISQSGRTVLFVSHNMQSITKLCDRALLMSQGMLIANGKSEDVVRTYIDEMHNTSSGLQVLDRCRQPYMRAIIESIRIDDGNGCSDGTLAIESPLTIEVYYKVNEPDHVTRLDISVDAASGERLLTVHSALPESHASGSRYKAMCGIDRFPLISGRYYFSVAIYSGAVKVDHVHHAMAVDVGPGRMSRSDLDESAAGHFLLESKWTFSSESQHQP